MSFVCKARRDGELLVVTIYGLMSASAQALMRQRIAEEIEAADCRAVVLDMRAGVFTLATTEEWVRAARDTTPTVPHPMAVVVPPWCMEGARAYCAEMAWRRRLRLAFESVAPALAWANSRRDHWPQPARPYYLNAPLESLPSQPGTRRTVGQDR